MRLSELFYKAGIAYPKKYADVEITDIETDSRRVGEGSLFV